jgi:hypothetical protein
MPSAIIVDVDLLDLFPSSEPFGLRLVSNYMVHPKKSRCRMIFIMRNP